MRRERTAVALKYDRRLPAPLVISRARGHLASQLVRIAEEHDIPVVEERAVGDALYFIEVGAFVPEPFYEAVAEILAFVWRSGGGDRAHGGVMIDSGSK